MTSAMPSTSNPPIIGLCSKHVATAAAFLTLALATPVHAQDAPPIALPGAPGMMADVQATPTDPRDVARMLDVLHRHGCSVHPGNRDAVLEAFGADAAKARAALEALKAEGLIAIQEGRGTARLTQKTGCVPVPVAAQDAELLG